MDDDFTGDEIEVDDGVLMEDAEQAPDDAYEELETVDPLTEDDQLSETDGGDQQVDPEVINDNTATLDTTVSVASGDRVIITLVDGEPIVTGVVGGGDILASEVDSAMSSATLASQAAASAQQSATAAQGSADAAAQAAAVADGKAVAAAGAAASAQTSADNAMASAKTANNSLSEVEKVVGTLNWIAEHGRYVNQAGQTFDASKIYYTRSGTSPNYTYTMVAEPVAADITSYYLLVVDESVQNYIASHVYLQDDGLYVTTDSATGYKVRIDGDSMDVLDIGGDVVASFGSSGAVIGEDGDLQMKISSNSLVLENDSDEDVFSVTLDKLVKSLKYDVLAATFSGTADTSAHSVSDTSACLEDQGMGAADAVLSTGGTRYFLSSANCTVTVTEGVGVSAQLTSAGKTYVESLMSDSGDDGKLYVNYWTQHYDDSVMEMDGSVSVSGHSNVVNITNDAQDPGSDQSAYYSVMDGAGPVMRLGLGESGTNRGIWDDRESRWMIHTDSNGYTSIGGLRVKTANQSTAVSVASSTYKSLASLSLEPGDWIITYGAQFASNATGRRMAYLYTTADTAGSATFYRATRVGGAATSGTDTYLHGSHITSPTSTTTYYLTLYQTSGSSLNCYCYMRAIKIG